MKLHKEIFRNRAIPVQPQPELPLPLFPEASNRRLIWMITRSVLEADNYKHLRYGEKRKQNWSLFELLIRLFEIGLKIFNLYQRGYDNATHIVINHEKLYFRDLPAEFHGYTLLHLTDIHADFIPGYEDIVAAAIRGLEYDACVMTGDYRKEIKGSVKASMQGMQKIVSAIRAKDGIFATLGNHDTYRMTKPLERLGITLLANESIVIEKGNSRVHITGVDDPYYYYTDQALTALEKSPDGFKIAIIHTPSLYDVAAENGYRLYLCGHTHGGQICLPGGYPVIVHLKHGRKYYRGLWRFKEMTGYTSQGCGTIGIPIRFNTESEVTLITLYRHDIGQ